MYRQGDVLIERVDEVPLLDRCDDRLLVRGEGRNHGHFIIGEGVDVYSSPANMDKNGAFVTHFLDVKEESVLEHLLIDVRAWTKEHDPIVIPPGKYKVIRQREYNPYARAIRMVKD